VGRQGQTLSRLSQRHRREFAGPRTSGCAQGHSAPVAPHDPHLELYYHEYQAQLAKVLTQASGLDRAFFCNSGTEAWEGALKIARAYGQTKAAGTNGSVKSGKTRILALDGSFHGRTFGSLSTTGQAKYRDPFEPLVPSVSFVAFNDVEDLERQFDSSVCALCIETIQGEGGIRPISKEFLTRARELTQQHGALLVLDEIQCGLGRTGRSSLTSTMGLKPDLVTVAKPLAAGLLSERFCSPTKPRPLSIPACMAPRSAAAARLLRCARGHARNQVASRTRARAWQILPQAARRPSQEMQFHP